MPIYVNIGGAQKQLSSLFGNVGGAQKQLNSMLANINGAAKELLPPSTLTIGGTTTDTSAVAGGLLQYGFTEIYKYPANGHGYINEINIRTSKASSNCIFAIFYQTDTNTFTARQSYSAGSLSMGLHTVTKSGGGSIFEVFSGDYLGVYLQNGDIYVHPPFGLGTWNASGNHTAAVNKSFSYNAQGNGNPSMQGIGEFA